MPEPDPFTEPEMDPMTQRVFVLIDRYARGRQSIFARMVGIQPQTLSKLKRQGGRPSSETLEAIARALPDVSSRWLLLGEGPMLDPNR